MLHCDYLFFSSGNQKIDQDYHSLQLDLKSDVMVLSKRRQDNNCTEKNQSGKIDAILPPINDALLST